MGHPGTGGLRQVQAHALPENSKRKQRKIKRKKRSDKIIFQDVFLLCFSLVNDNSFENVYERWHCEIKQYCPTAPVILVGTKMDLKTDPETLAKLKQVRKSVITEAQGHAMADKMGCVKYLECSALTQENLKKVYDEAITVGLNPFRPRADSSISKPRRGFHILSKICS